MNRENEYHGSIAERNISTVVNTPLSLAILLHRITFPFYAAINHNNGDKHWTQENRNWQNGSKSTNQYSQPRPFDHYT